MKLNLIRQQYRPNIFIRLSFFSLLFLLFSCRPEPEPINFGKDQCDHCRMLIVDNKFGAEIVSNKGKIYKFDATECMINFFRLGKINKDEVSFYLVTDASEPAELIDAIKSFYLISEKFPSPMGANLSAFERIETAEKFLLIYGGEIKNWYELLSYFNVK